MGEQAQVSRRTLVMWAIAANTLVAAIAFALYGWTAIGAHVAARSTARISVLVFLVAFAQPGLARWVDSLPSYVALVHAFVAAHCVHFVTVLITLVLDATHHLRRAPASVMAVLTVGFLLVLVSGITVGLRERRSGRVMHGVAIYAVFAIFLVAFVTNRFMPLRVVVLFLLVALGLRIAGMFPGVKKIALVNVKA